MEKGGPFHDYPPKIGVNQKQPARDACRVDEDRETQDAARERDQSRRGCTGIIPSCTFIPAADPAPTVGPAVPAAYQKKMSKGKKKKPIEQVLSGSGGLIKKSDINCHDVIKGRGHSTNNNPGNVHFKNRIRATQSEYFTSTNAEKKFVAAKLVAGIRNADPSGRFLELVETTDEGEFYKEIGDKDAWKSKFVPSAIII